MIPNGLYEQVANKALDDEPAGTDKLIETVSIDGAETAKALAKYVAEVVERGLENVKVTKKDLPETVDKGRLLFVAHREEILRRASIPSGRR